MNMRAVWWLGVPVAILGWLLAPRPSVFYIAWPVSYRVTGAALTLLVVVTTVSHIRRTRAVRTLSLLLPAYVAAFEACTHAALFGRCRSLASPPTWTEIHHELHAAATASVLAVAAALLTAGVLAWRCRNGVAGRVSWASVCAVPPLVAVVLLWSAMDRIFFR